MKAVVVKEDISSRPLVWTEVPTPEPGPGEVLVRVHACALNRADLHQRAGNYPSPLGASEILGLEMAGTIAELGADVTDWQLGERVCALLSGGGYAEYAVVPEQLLMSIPERHSFEEAAGVPEVFLTAYTNLFREGAAKRGETVLIHAGASGVGTAAIQLASRYGCTVYATAGTREKVATCECLGARRCINYREEDFASVLRSLQGFEGVDLVFDMVGKNYLERNLDLLRWRGRIVFVSLLSGSQVELDLRTLMVKRLSLVGTTLRQRSLEEKASLRDSFLKSFGADLASGKVYPVIDKVFPIQEVENAHTYMTENRNIGKIILRLPGST